MSSPKPLVSLYRRCHREKVKVKALLAASQVIDQPSYFPEEERKSRWQRLAENWKWTQKYGELNKFYNLYGFDLKKVGTDIQSLYTDNLSFSNSRDTANHTAQADSQVVLLRDKLLFFQYMKNHGFPVPEVFAYIRDGKVFNLDFDEIGFDALMGEKDYFLKNQSG